MKKLGFIVILSNILVACKASSPPLTPRQRPAVAPIERIESLKSGRLTAPKINPRVDILFVIDNSKSMENHLATMAKNMNIFVNQIAKRGIIDFHIGITFVYDRQLPQFCGPQAPHPGQKVFEDPGTLEVLDARLGARRFVTRADDFAGILKAKFADPKLIPTFVPLHDNEPTVCAQGPEREESAAPMLAALSNPVLRAPGGPNDGFRRDDAKFVAIIISDAKDEAITDGKISVAQVIADLNRLTGSTPSKKMARVFAVAVKPDSVQNRKMISYGSGACEPDPAFKVRTESRVKGKFTDAWPLRRTIVPEDSPLAQIAMATEDRGEKRVDQVLSICDEDYGSTLAKYGSAIEQDALADVVIKLDQPPQVFSNAAEEEEKGLAVFLGQQKLSNRQWSPEIIGGDYHVVIHVNEIDWNKVDPKAEFTVRSTPVDPRDRNAVRR